MYSHAPEDYICPFCSLVRSDQSKTTISVEADVVYRDGTITAFIGSHQWPNNPGNVIIIPNEHYENIYDLPTVLAVRVQELAKAVALAMKYAWECDGVSTRQHNEPAGNQDVWHYHLHVTPRYIDDGFYSSKRVLMPPDEREKYAKELAYYLADWKPTTA